MDYLIKHHFEEDTSMGNRSTLTIIGLKYIDPFNEVRPPEEHTADLPDTHMTLLGMESTMKDSLSIMTEIYRVLYDITQTSVHPVRDGDTFTVDNIVWHNYSGKHIIPKMTFTMHSFHLVWDNQNTLEALAKITKDDPHVLIVPQSPLDMVTDLDQLPPIMVSGVVKECCQNCRHLELNSFRGKPTEYYCTYRGEDVDDPSNETCFDFESTRGEE